MKFVYCIIITIAMIAITTNSSTRVKCLLIMLSPVMIPGVDKCLCWRV